MPIEICAANADTPTKSMAATKTAFVSRFILCTLRGLTLPNHNAPTQLAETAKRISVGGKANNVWRVPWS